MILRPEEIYLYARHAGFSPDQAVTMTAIALAESGGNTDAHNAVGEDSRGLWQVNLASHPDFAGLDSADPLTNARMAFQVSGGGADIGRWTVTHADKGARYLRYREEAEAASRAAGEDGTGQWDPPQNYYSPKVGAGPADGAEPPPLPDGQAGPVAAAESGGDPGDEPAFGEDTDRDGLLDSYERAAGTDPTARDTDRDGFSDRDEIIEHGTDATDYSDNPLEPVGDHQPEPVTAPEPVAAAEPASQGVPAAEALGVAATGPAVVGTAPSGGLDTFLDAALSQQGDPYIFGAEAALEDVDPDSFDCCLVAGTRVTTQRGAVPIEEVVAGDLVATWDEGSLGWRKVVACAERPVQDVFTVRTPSRSICASSNHPFLRLTRPPKTTGFDRTVAWDVEWARLDELQRGNYIVALDRYDIADPDPQVLDDGTLVDADVAWLIGLAIGAGHVPAKSGGLRVRVYGNTAHEAARIIEQVWRCLTSFRPDHGVIAGPATRPAFGPLLAGAADKRVPPWIWTASPSIVRALLAGYADADGHHDRRGHVTYHSASRALVEDVRALHLMLGDRTSNITTTERRQPIVIKGRVVRNARPLHSATWYPDSPRRQQTVLDTYAARRALPDRRFTVERVLAVSPAGRGATFDLEIEGTHNYVADGLVVHNSELVQWAAAQANVDIQDGSFNQYLQVKGMGSELTVEEALRTPGALLFRFSSTPVPGGGRPSSAHVAISLGDGRTIEARGRAYGVGSFDADGRSWTHAGTIPALGTELGAGGLGAGGLAATAPGPGGGGIVAEELSFAEDSDGDGLVDYYERFIGTDPFAADTDRDGFVDSAEVIQHGTDPLDFSDDPLGSIGGDGYRPPLTTELGGSAGFGDPGPSGDPGTFGDPLRPGRLGQLPSPLEPPPMPEPPPPPPATIQADVPGDEPEPAPDVSTMEAPAPDTGSPDEPAAASDADADADDAESEADDDDAESLSVEPDLPDAPVDDETPLDDAHPLDDAADVEAMDDVLDDGV